MHYINTKYINMYMNKSQVRICNDSIFSMVDDQIQDAISFYIESMELELTESQEIEFRFQAIREMTIKLREHYNITK